MRWTVTLGNGPTGAATLSGDIPGLMDAFSLGGLSLRLSMWRATTACF
jgi:hypothetical protein